MSTMRIFVSHSHKDNAFCQALVQALRGAGADVWYDEDNLGWGRIREKIEAELRQRSLFILILSPSALQSPWVRDETDWFYELYGQRIASILPVVAERVNENDLWLFLRPFKRIAQAGGRPYPSGEAIRRTLNILGLKEKEDVDKGSNKTKEQMPKPDKVDSSGGLPPTRVPRLFRRQRLWLGVGLVVLLVGIVGGRLIYQITSPPATPPLPAGEVREFRLPDPNFSPIGDITVGPDGNLWFTECLVSSGGCNLVAIGRITPAGQITEFPFSTPLSELINLTAGPDGNLWFTEYSGNKIGRITPAGKITEFPLSAPDSHPDNLTAGPDGNLWFTEWDANKIGRITRKGQITEFKVPIAGYIWAVFADKIAVGPDDNLWFWESDDDIWQMTLLGSFMPFALPTPYGPAGNITKGPDGNLWFAVGNSDSHTFSIGRLTPWGSFTGFGPSPATLITSRQGQMAIFGSRNVWLTKGSATRLQLGALPLPGRSQSLRCPSLSVALLIKSPLGRMATSGLRRGTPTKLCVSPERDRSQSLRCPPLTATLKASRLGQMGTTCGLPNAMGLDVLPAGGDMGFSCVQS